MFHDFLPAVEDAKYFSQIFLKVLESGFFFFAHITTPKIYIWNTEDLFLENMRKWCSLIALTLSCSELKK